MSLYTSTTKLLLRYVLQTLKENENLWDRTAMMSLDDFDMILDLYEDIDASNLGLYSMKISFNKNSSYLEKELKIGYGISFIEFYVDYSFVEYFDFTTTYFNFPMDFKFNIVVKTINSKIHDGEKLWKKKVYFDLDDKSKIYEVDTLNKMYLSEQYLRIFDLSKKLENLLINKIKYKSFIKNKDEFIFELPIELLNKESLSLYYQYLYLLCSNDRVSLLINFNEMNFTYVDEESFWNDIEGVFLSSSLYNAYDRLIFIYDKKIPDVLLEILKDKFNYVHYINYNINITYSNIKELDGLIDLKFR